MNWRIEAFGDNALIFDGDRVVGSFKKVGDDLWLVEILHWPRDIKCPIAVSYENAVQFMRGVEMGTDVLKGGGRLDQ